MKRSMKRLTVDMERAMVDVVYEDGEASYALDTAQGFEAVSQAWVRCGWDAKHVYSFTWMGRPIIQLPEDMLRLQEVIHRVKPDVIVETGIAHGGSLIFYASLFEAMGHGRVIGVDIEIRPHNRQAIEEHPLFHRIEMFEGSSVAPEIVEQVHDAIGPDERVMVILDSNHLRDHVAAELEAYSGLVSPGSYIVACDGIMGEVVGAPRTQEDWSWNNPETAAREFAERHPEFVLGAPAFEFNDGAVEEAITYWPGAWLKKS